MTKAQHVTQLLIILAISVQVLCPLYVMAHTLDQLNSLITAKESAQTRNQSLPLSQRTPQTGWASLLQKNYLLIVFYSSQCQHCQRFMPLLREVVASYQLPIEVYTVDGKALPSFPDAITADQPLLMTFFSDVQKVMVPAVFLLNKDNLQAYPVNYGAMEQSAWIQRLVTLMDNINREARYA